MKLKNNQTKGFTIIEVVLVLAIAGLIFLMVFIALPALQRNQRDTARKNEASKVLSAITSFQSNNRGSTPTAAQLAGYLDADSTTDDGVTTVTMKSGTTVSKEDYAATKSGITADEVVFIMKAKCNAPGDTDGTYKLTSGSARQAVALIKLENGGAVFCQES